MSEASYRAGVKDTLAKAESAEEVIGIVIGAASVLWDKPGGGTGVFMAEYGVVLAQEAMDALEHWGLPE